MPRTILIVDDIQANRLILTHLLRGDYDILEAAGGEEALEILGREGERVSAVLLDIYMPGIDGYEVLRRIRSDASLARLPVIMITASEEPATRIKSLSLGANDFVTKPYSMEIIRHCLDNNIAFQEASATISYLQQDRLTGILNQEAFFRKAERQIEEAEPGALILACVDIDNFKVINDQYGGETGDKVLISLAGAIQASCDNNGGICGRIFADRFVSLYPRPLAATGLIGPEHLEACVLVETGISLTLSVGRYIVEDKTLDVSAMYDRATIAQRKVKGRYDMHVAVYDESMRSHIVREQGIVNDMNAALVGKQFEVWYQPQYNHATGAMIGAEALVRWRHPRKGLIAPDAFIRVFEQNGFIYTMDKYVWEEVCRFLRARLDEGGAPLPVSVNISRYDLLRPDVVETITSLVRRYDLPIDLLRLEVTESVFAKDTDIIIAVVRALIDDGFTVEIDDFGSGYSSLNTLKDVPAQIIKLDMKFLRNNDDSQRGGNIVESVVRMAKWLDMSVIAEGVETLEQADYLLSIGCGYMQGYLYARPMQEGDYLAHCANAKKEERLLAIQAVENLNNNAFWDPKSMDTLIFNSYVGAACIFEYHNRKIELLRVNKKFTQILGGGAMPVEDVLRLDWIACLEPESLRLVREVLTRSAQTGEEYAEEYVLENIPGCAPKTYLRATMRVIATVGDRMLVYCTSDNITAQRQAENRERLAMEQISSMMDDMPGGFVKMRADADGSVKPVYINEGYAKLVNISRDALMDQFSEDFLLGVHPDEVPLVQASIRRMLESFEAQNLRYRQRRADGSYIWLSVVGRATKDASGNAFLNVYYADATEHVVEEEAQKRLLDNLPCGAGVYEFKDGQMSLTYQNKSYWALVGLNEARFPDPTPMSAIHPDYIPVIMQDLAGAIAQNRDVSCDILLRHLTLGYRPMHLAGRIIREEDGAFSIYATFAPIDTVSPPVKPT